MKTLYPNQSGAILILFGLLLVPLLGLLGYAVDWTRAQAMQRELQAAVDAAAFAGGKSFHLGDDGLKKVIQDYFAENWWTKPRDVRLGAFTVGIDRVGTTEYAKRLAIHVDAYVPTYFLAVIGVRWLHAAAETSLAVPRIKDDESR